MPLPHNDSLVTYPNGVLAERATVLHVTAGRTQTLLLTDSTPFHPVDPRWPDQGPDRGTITFGDHSATVIDCVVGATEGSALFVGDAVPVRRGEPGWAFVVVHILPPDGPVPVEGDQVTLAVDPAHRAALSAGHTGCHLAALALNAAMAGRWRRATSVDGLGHPDFDQLAITSSRIEPDGAVDTYRIGRSLRKKGFDVELLTAALPSIAEQVNATLLGWVATGAPIELRISGPRLTDLREWVCFLPEGTQQIPCGGTHLHSLAEVQGITVELRYDEDAGELIMTTSVHR